MVKPRQYRVPIMLSEYELTKIDDWRYQNRVATRSQAIRKLCDIGMRAQKDLVEISKALSRANFRYNETNRVRILNNDDRDKVFQALLDYHDSYQKTEDDLNAKVLELQFLIDEISKSLIARQGEDDLSPETGNVEEGGKE